VRILVGYDGSEAAKRALGVAARLAGDYGHVLVANVSPALQFGLPNPVWIDEQEPLLDEASAILREAGVAQPETMSPLGDAVDGLVAAAKEADVDLLVVGTHGRGAAGRFIAGSVSVGVARKAPCDVLVVP
jgi:nucleotide-binding universal stress UspA family protein